MDFLLRLEQVGFLSYRINFLLKEQPRKFWIDLQPGQIAHINNNNNNNINNDNAYWAHWGIQNLRDALNFLGVSKSLDLKNLQI